MSRLAELRANVTDRGPWYVVPAGRTSTKCNGCEASIYFIRTPRGKMMPVDCAVPGGRLPSETTDPTQSDLFGAPVEIRDGRGVSHFATCPESERFRMSGAGR